MGRKIPQFPSDYIGSKAEEYDRQKWMERNQKRTTLKCIQYLFDTKLGKENNSIRRNIQYIILDLGCGTGFSSEALIENGFRVIGVDILSDMLTIANQKKKIIENSNLELILADINYLPLKFNSIHHIISISTYNFITHEKYGREKRKVVNNTAKYLNKILKGSGRVIIEFYPENEEELDLYNSSFVNNGFEGFLVKKKQNQKAGQTYLLLKKKR
ncbi:MAG: class I SAM-dependent methyltransferase [Candidatus Thorarchaeota archaeon]